MAEFVKFNEVEEKEFLRNESLKKLEALQLLLSLMIFFNCLVIIMDKLFFQALGGYLLLHVWNLFVVFHCMENSKRWRQIKKIPLDKIIISKNDK